MKCHDCKAEPGELHVDGCDIERCSACGGQRIGCECGFVDARMPWSGEYPGLTECREYGLWSVGPPWKSVPAGTPDAREDLNRLMSTCFWSAQKQKWVRNRNEI
jgi:hypothetical protein